MVAIPDEFKEVKARLVTPQFFSSNKSSGYCFSWWYHMKGSSIGTLSVYASSNNRSSRLWQYSEDIGSVWNAAQITVSLVYKSFSFIIEG